MKRITLCISALFLFVCMCSAQTATETTLAIKLHQETGSGTRPRSIPPITAIYSYGTVQVYFLQDIGSVTITIVNNTTGEQWFETANSSNEVVALSDTPGYYTIYIVLESGVIYFGDFSISQ